MRILMSLMIFVGWNSFAENVGIENTIQIPAAMSSQVGTIEIDGRLLLTDANQITVYTFDDDNVNETTCFGSCLRVWPPVVADASQVVAPFSTITRDDGTVQLAIDGLPLYYFFRDQNPGDLFGEYEDWRPVPVAQ